MRALAQLLKRWSIHRLIFTYGIAVAVMALAGCSVLPFRPYTGSEIEGGPCRLGSEGEKLYTTPELDQAKTFTLDFVEFDDQGWAFPDGTKGGRFAATPGKQIDCVLADLRHTLESENGKVLTFVYVHGWKHSAKSDDRDVLRFKELLRTRAQLFPDRRVVGIYVGWQGHTVDVWGLDNLTFWSRKNAAQHVAEGRVRELFSRIRGLRAYWNSPRSGEPACDWSPATADDCRIRTVMIGHSFGGLILYNSAAPYLLEMLSIDRDLPATEKRPRAARSRSIADLIVLLNPAFEGTRFEPVHQASLQYKPEEDEPPLLVMLTSTADWATKNAFPVARWINSVFQYPSSSDDQSEAMRQTPGHIERYLTHKLCLGDRECQDRPNKLSDARGLTWGDQRELCDGLKLRAYSAPNRPARSIVWNVRTHAGVIPDHNEIDGEAVFGFVERLYGDVTGRNASECQDSLVAPAASAK